MGSDQENVMRIGAHVSTSGGLSTGIDRAAEMGAEAIQIFASSPRMWRFNAPSEDQVLAFREKAEEENVAPVFIHGSYLVNVGGTPDLVEKSVECLTRNMEVAGQIGAAGVIFHGGSHKGAGFDAIIDQATDALKEVLASSPTDVWLMIENSAGMGAHVGASFEEIATMIEAIDRPNVKVCLDTQHSVAAGYDLTSSDGIEEAMGKFDALIGLSRLAAVHANDSKIELGGGVDRHENIGEGHIGVAGFENIMGHPAFRDVPFILEVPGFEKKGPDKENLDRLKDVRTRLGIGA